MPSYYTLTSGTTAQAQDVNQLINAMNGSAGNGIPTSLTAVNDSVNFSLAVKNADPTNSRALQVLRANNNVLIQADASGVIVSPDGGATTGQVLTVNATQTLTNKTLTSPHFTTPVVDSGGLTVTAGGLTVTAGGLNVAAGTLSVGPTPYAASGQIRLANTQQITWRNGANSADDFLSFDGVDRLMITGPVVATTATAGGTATTPTTNAGYLPIVLNATAYKIALFPP